MSNLKKLFLTGEGLNILKDFLTKHWYVGIGVGLGLIIVIVSIVLLCVLLVLYIQSEQHIRVLWNWE